MCTDIWGGRWISGYHVATTAICSATILLVPTASIAAKFGAYYWAGINLLHPGDLFAWANDSMRSQSPTLRAVVIACMNFEENLFQVWWPLILYRTDDEPNFTKGQYAIGVGTMMAIWTTVMLWIDRRIGTKGPEVLEAAETVSSDGVEGICVPQKVKHLDNDV
ncbi:hypothetical protein LQW54_008539 [Pestalotiopsis sp. IQ-011]